MGDFNMQPTDNNFQTFCESHDLYNLIKNKTCFKTIKGTCIDLILTNQKCSFRNTCTVETGISDFQVSNMQTANVNKNNFWKTIGPFISNKSVKQAKKLILIEQNDIVSDDSKIAEIFSKHFSEITKSLNIPEYAPKDNNFTKIEDPVLRAIEKYKDHPRIVRISGFSSTNHDQKRFQFKHFYPWEVRTKIFTARNKNSDLQVPMMILKQCTDSCVTHLTDLINNIVNDQNRTVELGSVSIAPAHKKLSKTDKGNYRPISVLPSISKIFEKLLYEQLSDFMKDKLSPFLCGFRKQHSTQHALIRVIEKWKNLHG